MTQQTKDQLEASRVAADLRYNEMKNSQLLQQQEQHRALLDQIKWMQHD